MSSSHGEDHGGSPAAWTAVFLCIIGFAIGGGALMASMPALAIVGGAIALVSPIVGKAMSAMGLGAAAK
jgi:predicted membrane-bound spermidine synthase